jgi:molecular chaperone HscC
MTTSDEGLVVGIDLGTTFSLVAVLEGGVPRIVPNALGEALTPSAVSVDDAGHVLVGAAARARAATHPERTATAFKRDMGTSRKVTLGGRSFRPEELSALVLASLKADAEAALGRPVAEAVVTVPAYFGDLQRKATRDAAQIAGLHVERIINEPTAAALAYGMHHRDRDARVVVLDLGGGTFDVTVLEIVEGVIEIQASAGDARLGGEDFTDAVAALLEANIAAQHGLDLAGDSIARARVREAAERAKRALGRDEEVRVALPALGGARRSVDVELTLARAEVEACFDALLGRVRDPILRALADARRRPADIDDVLLVGGATRMPSFRRLAGELFGRIPRHDLPPDEAVALGASVQAALKRDDAAVADIVATDVAPFTLGIASATRVGTRMVEGIFAPILERGTVIPASRVERFFTMEDGQTRLDVRIYQGEHSTCAENTLLGTYMIKNLPKAPAGKAAVDVRLTYDLNGLLEVEMSVVGTGRTEHLVIERNPGQLSEAEVEQARRAMARLKFHPRETLPNRTALARADALFAELKGEERAMLGACLAELRGVLESQDTRAIDEVRARLLDIMEHLAARR